MQSEKQRYKEFYMKYALIGCGRISPNHIASALENHLDIAAVCDIDETQTERTVRQFNLSKNVKRYTDYKKMLSENQLDLIAIATESGKHAAIALDCIAAGCNLIVEKPIALSIEGADQIIAAAKKNNVKVCACHQNRFNKSIQKIREAMEAGRFGRLFYGTAHIRWNRNQDYYTQAPWRGTYAQDGGALMNQCIHNIDLLRWMMGGEVESVSAFTDNLNHSYIEAEDLGIAVVKFKNGAYGIIEGTTNIYPQNLEETLYLFGEQGTVKAGGRSVNIIEEWRFGDGLDDAETVKRQYQENPPNVYGFGHSPLYKDVIEAIEKNRAPYVDAKQGKDALELVLAIYKAAKEKSVIVFPLERVGTVDFVGSFKKV